jgi:heme-degrading monooxygenase HmoA
MFAVIFEVEPKPERWEDYLATAGRLRPALEAIEGFVANERFAEVTNRGRLLSLSIWRDEKALIRWRTLALHHDAQVAGRSQIFADYHLRVGEIVADSHRPAGPAMRLDETEVGAAKAVTLTEHAGEPPALDPAADGLLGHARFESITEAGKFLLLASWRDQRTASAWTPPGGIARDRQVRVIRDYGLRDRREAPQFYPPVDA